MPRSAFAIGLQSFLLRFEGKLQNTMFSCLQCIGGSDGNSYALQTVAVPVSAVRRAGIRMT